MVKFKVDYNENTEKPELVFEYNTASTVLDVKMIRRFWELIQNVNTLYVHGEKTDKGNGVSEIRLSAKAIATE